MLEIALLTSAYLVLLTGLGLFFPWSLFRSAPSYRHLLSAFWIGFAITIAFLQLSDLSDSRTLWLADIPETGPCLVMQPEPRPGSGVPGGCGIHHYFLKQPGHL